MSKATTKRIMAAMVFITIALSVRAETLYVTDRILLGVHQVAHEQSPVITSVASGAALTVLSRSDDFIKVRTPDGVEGWVSAKFVKKDKPASVELDGIYAKLQQEQEISKKLSAELTKLERELQVRRDEVSNAKTTIKELESAVQRAKTANPAAAAAVVDNTELNKAKAEISALQAKIVEYEKAKTTEKEIPERGDLGKKLQSLDDENQALRVRIEAALANLKGEKVPTNAELAAVRPKFPFWYWIVLLFVLSVGAGAGIYTYDYLNRKRHGGFRI